MDYCGQDSFLIITNVQHFQGTPIGTNLEDSEQNHDEQLVGTEEFATLDVVKEVHLSF